jgi:hypothetical protein
MVTEAVYEKAYPESWGAAVDSKNTTLSTEVVSNRPGVVYNLKTEGITLREENVRKMVEQASKMNKRKQPW